MEDKESTTNNKIMLDNSSIAFQLVESIPEREYHFKIGEKTQEYIAILSSVKPGGVAKFSVNGSSFLPKKERTVLLNGVRDRLKVAVKHAPGYWDIKCRQQVFYARRLSEEGEDYEEETSY